MFAEFIISAALFFLVAASYLDLRTGEIPDKISIGMAGLFLFIALINSVFSSNPVFIVNSAVVGVSYFIVAYLLFRLGQWGGGDVKLFAGIGCLLGYMNADGMFNTLLARSILPYYIVYLTNMGFAAIPYVTAYSLILSLKHPAVFTNLSRELHKPYYLVLLGVSIILSVFFSWSTESYLFFIVPLYLLFSIYLRIVEKIALRKTVRVDELSVGDIPAQDIIINGEPIAKKNDMEGMTQEQIEQIKRLALGGKIPKEIEIKWGIKFAPIFLLAFIALITIGNMLEILILP